MGGGTGDSDESVADVVGLVQRYFVVEGQNPYESDSMGYELRDVQVKYDKGTLIEELDGAIFPKFWSANASNTVATKYFRKAEIPGIERENDIRQLTGRVARGITRWGLNQGHISEAESEMFEKELVASSIFQYGAFNSPVWFSVGLDSYDINQEGENFFYVGHDSDGVRMVENYYEHPQASACFIMSPEDSIESMIQVGAVASSRIFKAGSGIGGDWSNVRSAGEPVSGGGKASGAVRFMDLQDSTGRVIKSGGKTRRAATMQSIGVWHPDMPEVLRHKYKEEEKARALIKAGSPNNWESHTIQDLRAQNVNISIRTDDDFWRTYESGGLYDIKNVTDGAVVRQEPAEKLLEMMAFAAHNCGDPGIQNHSIINKWNTCKNSGEIWASNPCSEFMFLDNTSCNLASLNLMRFRKENGEFDLNSFQRAVDLYITAQDAIVSEASYPTEEIAWNSHIFRPLGLGFANLGAYVMSLGLPYDSDEAREFAEAVASNMTAQAYLQSTRLAEKLGSFQEFEKNRESMLEVIGMHRRAAKSIPAGNGLEELVSVAIDSWDEVVDRGTQYGFRNAQTTLLAPTGTIGFMMDCDTTGCEPTYALKKFKELAGGGSLVEVNQTVPLALERLGYDKKQIEKIRAYIDEKGTVEGSLDLEEEHLSVFDCAVSPEGGTRVIPPIGHVKMLGSIQPHISGAISKTVNCPSNMGVEGIGDLFYQAWNNGVKAIAVYRDGSKASQPLRTQSQNRLEILTRGDREHLPKTRIGLTQKVKVGDTTVFIRTGEYDDGRLGELFLDSFERGSEVNRLLNTSAIQFSEKLQLGASVGDAIEVFGKAGQSEISGLTDHPFIRIARGIDGFLYNWIKAHYIGDISNIPTEPEMRPVPKELRIYQQVPELHLLPTVAGEKFYPGVPSLEETIEEISGTNYWIDEGLDTRKTVDKILRTRKWKSSENDAAVFEENDSGVMRGVACSCGSLMISDGSCLKCPSCKTSTGGCGGG